MTKTLSVTFSKKAFKYVDLDRGMAQTWRNVEHFYIADNHELQFRLSDGTEVRVILKHVLMWNLKDNK